MKYKIKSGNKVIAQFEYEADRNICLEALIDAYEDCELKAIDE